MDSRIPQEKNSALNGERKVMYAKGESGKYETHKYSSNAEEFATKTAVYEYELLEKESLQRIKEGISSPIEYFMYKNRMDIPTLSGFVGMFSFRVKRHLKMRHFKKLNDNILQKYADAFGISLEELKSS